MKRSAPTQNDSENEVPASVKRPFVESVESHPFSFPFTPYSTQLKLMKDLYEILSQGGIGILESPTGTGKTLTSLCAVLTFIEDENKKSKELVTENREKARSLREGWFRN